MKVSKDKYQIFTPNDIVKEMLNQIGYTKTVFNKKIIDNSFGSGNILSHIVDRYINISLNEGYSLNEIRKGLSRDIHGYEIDLELIEHTKIILDNLCKLKGIIGVKWSLSSKNTLMEDAQKFDYIVSNPPYVRFKNLSDEYKDLISEKYPTSAHGLYDIFYAFIEWGYNSLSQIGKMVYLIPSSFYKSSSSISLRNKIKKNVVSITDYKHTSIFGKYSTTVSLLLIDINNTDSRILYILNSEEINVDKLTLSDKWIFSQNFINDGEYLFSDHFKIGVGVATLKNQVYLLDQNNEYNIEEQFVKSAVSKKQFRRNNDKLILFPYLYLENNEVCQLRIEDLSEYPFLKAYLEHNKVLLSTRDIDDKINWYEYGRSQGVAHMNNEKIYFSTFFKDRIDTYLIDENSIPYSGIYIVNSGEFNLQIAQEILDSDDFFEYIKLRSKSVQGKNFYISVRDVKKYRFNL